MHNISKINTPYWQNNNEFQHSQYHNNQNDYLPQISFPSQQNILQPPQRLISYIKHQQNPLRNQYSQNPMINQSTQIHPNSAINPLDDLHHQSSNPPSNHPQISPTHYNPAWPYSSSFNQFRILQPSPYETIKQPQTPSFFPPTIPKNISPSNENYSNNYNDYPQNNHKLNPLPIQQLQEPNKPIGPQNEDQEPNLYRYQYPTEMMFSHSKKQEQKQIYQDKSNQLKSNMSPSINELKYLHQHVNFDKSQTTKIPHLPSNPHEHFQPQQRQSQYEPISSKTKKRSPPFPSKNFLTKVKGLRNTTLYPAPSLASLPKNHQLQRLPLLRQLLLTNSQQSWYSSSSSCNRNSDSPTSSNQQSPHQHTWKNIHNSFIN